MEEKDRQEIAQLRSMVESLLRSQLRNCRRILHDIEGIDLSSYMLLLEVMYNLPNEPIAVRRYGGSPSSPPQSLADMTFQELCRIPWSDDDPRPIAIALVELFEEPIRTELFGKPVVPEHWKTFLAQRKFA